jgi:hypothetical protein
MGQVVAAAYARHIEYMLEKDQAFRRSLGPFGHAEAPPSRWVKAKRRAAYRVEWVRLKVASFIAGYDVTEGGCWDD